MTAPADGYGDVVKLYDDARIMPPESVSALVAICRAAEDFKFDIITAARFAVVVGSELARVVCDDRAAFARTDLPSSTPTTAVRGGSG